MVLSSLFDEFDLLIDTPDSIPKLRRLVLRLALKGELTERRSEDSPVEKLIERMQEERKRLYDLGEIRKPRTLDPLSQEEEWYSIPSKWKWAKVGEVGRIVGGSTPRTSNEEYWAEEGIAWLTPGDLGKHEKKKIARGDRDISKKGLDSCSATLLPPGSVLFSSRAPIGYVAIAASELATNQGFKSVRPYEMRMSDYIYWFLRYAGKRINDEASGTTFTEVSGTNLANIPFPLPPIEEQQRIVETIESLMRELDSLEVEQKQEQEKRSEFATAATHSLRTADSEKEVQTAWTRIREHFDPVTSDPDNLNDLRKSILDLAVQGHLTEKLSGDTPAEDMLRQVHEEKDRLYDAGEIRKPKDIPPVQNEPYSLPETWCWARFNNLAKDIRYGTSQKASESDLGVPVLRMGNIDKNGKLHYDDLKYISPDSKDLPKLYLTQVAGYR